MLVERLIQSSRLINTLLSFNRSKKSGSAEEQQRLHQRGCNCKRSGCLKNYCECYEAKIGCSANCRCLGKIALNMHFIQH